MTKQGPHFLDEEAAPASPLPRSAKGDGGPGLPHGPILLAPEPDAPTSLQGGWQPEMIARPSRSRIGNIGWMAIGIAVLLVAWIVLSSIAYVLDMLHRSLFLGGVAMLAFGSGVILLAFGAIAEWRSYRSLQAVDLMRIALTRPDQPIEVARAVALAWLGQVERRLPEAAAVEQAIRVAETSDEVVYLLRNRVAAPLRDVALQLGRRAAVDVATLIAISPHASWDGVIAGTRGLAVIRQVARLYGLRPGTTVTIVLVRKVAWTAAATAGLDLLGRSVVNEMMSVPVIARQLR